MRILLIEDEVQLSDALVAVFKKQHYSTDAVYSGDEGYEYARTGIYDVILLDVMLPGTDGFTVLKKLRFGGEPVLAAGTNLPRFASGVAAPDEAAAAVIFEHDSALKTARRKLEDSRDILIRRRRED